MTVLRVTKVTQLQELSHNTKLRRLYMLSNANAVPNIPVKNLETARKFYHDTLGLMEARSEDNEVIVFTSGDSLINVYRSQFAGTNKATALTWAVDDVDAEVRALKAKGVTFEHYDMPGPEA
jgi:catechol 2,3-dioxygenase-like lactoylglutathione lyase family enzyme